LLRLGRPDEAFAVADAARSGELLRRIGAARDGARSGALPRELVESEDLLRRIDDLVEKLRQSERGRRRERGEVGDSADAALASQLERARSEYEALTIRLAQQRPRAVAVLGSILPGWTTFDRPLPPARRSSTTSSRGITSSCSW
jgi:hypothetical protein